MNVVLTQVNILANTLDLRILQVVKLIQPFFLIKKSCHIQFNITFLDNKVFKT